MDCVILGEILAPLQALGTGGTINHLQKDVVESEAVPVPKVTGTP